MRQEAVGRRMDTAFRCHCPVPRSTDSCRPCSPVRAAGAHRVLPWSGRAFGLASSDEPRQERGHPREGPRKTETAEGTQPTNSLPPLSLSDFGQDSSCFDGSRKQVWSELPLVTRLLWPHRGAARVLDVPAAACRAAPFSESSWASVHLGLIWDITFSRVKCCYVTNLNNQTI